jgi:voltage-dependent potassium channel beta subunit
MAMTYRRLGTSGLKVSSLSFGSWITFGRQMDVDAAAKLMSAAYDGGITLFDNAEGYEGGRAEAMMGEALKKLAWRRDSYVVTTKVFFGHDADNPRPTQFGLCRKHVIEACDTALRRLQVDHLDLYFAHRADPETPVLETVRAMSDLVTQGKILYWGTSEWPAEKIIEAHTIAERWRLVAPTMEQPQYNMLINKRFEEEYRPLYELYGMGTTIWSPLASGVLTGKYLKGVPAGSRLSLPGYEWMLNTVDEKGPFPAVIRQIVALAERIGISPARLAVAWCLRNPRVSSVILGATRIDQLQETLKSIDDVALITDEVAAEITRITAPVRA